MTNHKPCKRDHAGVSHYWLIQTSSFCNPKTTDSYKHPLSATQNQFSCVFAHLFSGRAQCWTWRGWSAPSPRKKCSVCEGLYLDCHGRIQAWRPTLRRTLLWSQLDRTPPRWSEGCVRSTWLVRRAFLLALWKRNQWGQVSSRPTGNYNSQFISHAQFSLFSLQTVHFYLGARCASNISPPFLGAFIGHIEYDVSLILINVYSFCLLDVFFLSFQCSQRPRTHRHLPSRLLMQTHTHSDISTISSTT